MSASTSSAPPISSFASGDALIASVLAAERPRAARAAAAPAPAPAVASAPAPAAAPAPMPARTRARVKASAPADAADGPSIGDAIAAAAVRDVAPADAVVDVPRKPRRGRRRLAGKEKRAHCYSVRANADEQRLIEAKRGKLPAGEFLRLAAIGFQPVPAVPAINEQAWTELSRVGSNLNQIAKRLNGSDAAREATQLLDVLRELRFALHGAKLPEPESPAA